ncbi:hypothetical protein DPMN_163882 [Dreissena polymorpha]|uniref:Uncharacterized protein n=1 Tax=Dreissena polymorpha TaxID=45954 RepID=A0A9D4EUT3_DREPO|nr:hypothetical protein DPMN_163882 [Dreissena polymorpha]
MFRKLTGANAQIGLQNLKYKQAAVIVPSVTAPYCLTRRRGGEYDADNDADITAENDVYDDDDDTKQQKKLKIARQRPTQLLMGPCIDEIDCIVIRDVQYQFEVNRCRNEEVNFPGSSANSTDGRTDGGFQGSNVNSVGEDNGWDGRTAEITHNPHLFSEKRGDNNVCTKMASFIARLIKRVPM